MNAKATATVTVKTARKVVTRSKMRVLEADYQAIAKRLRLAKEDVTTVTLSNHAAAVLGHTFPRHEATEVRLAKVRGIIRDMDAAESVLTKVTKHHAISELPSAPATAETPAQWKASLEASIKTALDSALKVQAYHMLEGQRKLLLAQEARYEQRYRQQNKVLVALCKEWGVAVPEIEEPAQLPIVEASGEVVKLPRILVYGLQANQKQPLHDLIRTWDLKDVADIDVAYSTEHIAGIKRGYDIVIVNRRWVGVDVVRELRSHGTKMVEASGALSDVGRHLQTELLGLAIEAKKREEGQAPKP